MRLKWKIIGSIRVNHYYDFLYRCSAFFSRPNKCSFLIAMLNKFSSMNQCAAFIFACISMRKQTQVQRMLHINRTFNLCSPYFLAIFSGIRQQNDSLLMIYYHDQVVAIGKSISTSRFPIWRINSWKTISTYRRVSIHIQKTVSKILYKMKKKTTQLNSIGSMYSFVEKLIALWNRLA